MLLSDQMSVENKLKSCWSTVAVAAGEAYQRGPLSCKLYTLRRTVYENALLGLLSLAAHMEHISSRGSMIILRSSLKITSQ